jgi:hypothetical protein
VIDSVNDTILETQVSVRHDTELHKITLIQHISHDQHKT